MSSASRTGILFTALIATVPARAPTAEPTTYFPNGTMLIVSLNFRQLLDAPLVRENASARIAVAETAKALEGLGVTAKELDRVVVAVGEQLRSSSAILLMHGRFDADRVQGRLKERARERKNEIDVIEDAGATIFQCRLPRPSSPNPRFTPPDRFALTVVDSNTIALALDRSALAEVLAKKSGRKKTEVKPQLAELAGRMDAKETLSVVFVPNSNLVADTPATGLLNVTGGVTVGDSVVTQMRLEARDVETMRTLADSIRDGLAKVRDILPGLAALQFGLDRTGQDAIREMVDSIRVTSRDNSVLIAVTVTRETIEKASRR
jgi:hypothetical protein